MAKTLLEQFRFNVKVIRLCSKVCGVDFPKWEYRLNFITWIVIAVILLYYIATFYTIYVNFVENGDWTTLLQIICFMGSGTQGVSKLYSGIAYQFNIALLFKELDSIYEHYEQKRNGYKYALFKKVSMFIAGVYIALCSALVLSVIYFRIFQNRREFMMHFDLPGIDKNTEEGYIILNAFQLLVVIFGCFGNFAADMYFITLTTHMPLLKDILSCKFEDLNVIVEIQNNNGVKSMELLKDIFAWHQKYMRFINLITETYFWVLIVQIVTVSISLGCTLFCLLMGKWPIGFMYLIYCFIMLYIYCGLGTLVEIANDGFIYSCYNDTLWYKYSIKEQKMLLIMLKMSQNTTGLTVGTVYPLSVNTALQVTKMIYSFTMMLISFMD